MNKIKLIYFDIGNVTANTDNNFKGVTQKFNIDLKEFTLFWLGNDKADDMTKGKITTEEFWLTAIKKFNLKNAENFDFLESWLDDYIPILEVHQLARELSFNYPIGLISNLYPGMYPRLIEKGKVADMKYSAVTLSCDVGFRKPEKEIYELATQKARIKPEEIFFIDDKEEFIKGAKDYSWQTYKFDYKNINKSVDTLRNILF